MRYERGVLQEGRGARPEGSGRGGVGSGKKRVARGEFEWREKRPTDSDQRSGSIHFRHFSSLSYSVAMSPTQTRPSLLVSSHSPLRLAHSPLVLPLAPPQDLPSPPCFTKAAS